MLRQRTSLGASVLVSALFVILCAQPTAADTFAFANIKSVTIESAQGGLGPGTVRTLAMNRQGDRFVSSGQEVDQSSVLRLIEALAHPATVFSMNAVGITNDWIQNNRETIATKPGRPFDGTIPTPSQRRLVLDHLADPVFVRGLVRDYYERPFMVWDDNPSVQIVVERMDGTRVVAQSSHQQILMLPWTIVDGASTTDSYSSAIGSAVASLLPKGAPNVRRLELGSMVREISNLLYSRQHGELYRAVIADTIEPSLRPLRRSTFITTEEVFERKNYVDVSGRPIPPYWSATLRDPRWPQNLRAWVALTVKKNSAVGVEELLESLQRSVAIIHTFRWVDAYMSSHPGEMITMDHRSGAGISSDALEGLEDQLVGCGTGHLTKTLSAPALFGVTLLVGAPDILGTTNGEETFSPANWIVLSDGRVFQDSQNYLMDIGSGWKHTPAGSLALWRPECAIYSRMHPPPHFPYAGDDYRLQKTKGPAVTARPSSR